MLLKRLGLNIAELSIPAMIANALPTNGKQTILKHISNNKILNFKALVDPTYPILPYYS